MPLHITLFLTGQKQYQTVLWYSTESMQVKNVVSAQTTLAQHKSGALSLKVSLTNKGNVNLE
jgi:hypothetical protein